MADPSLEVVALLALAALAAGFVDAVVGGGGLIQLPALVIGLPGATPVQVLATNKLASIAGTTTSSVTYYRRVHPDPRTFLPLMAFAFLGSLGGAVVASQIPREAFDPIVLVVLVVVGGYVLVQAVHRDGDGVALQGRRHTSVAAAAVGLVIGFYDGALGPGTGSFFVFALVGLLGYTSWRPPPRRGWPTGRPTSRRSRLHPAGAVLWRRAHDGRGQRRRRLPRGPGGGGRRCRFVRIFFLVVVSAFVVRIGGGVLGLF